MNEAYYSSYPLVFFIRTLPHKLLMQNITPAVLVASLARMII